VLRSRPLLVAFAASASLALVLASSVAVAQSGDSDGDGVPDDLENATQRNVVAVAAGDSFDIQSRLASAPYEDQFEVFYQAGAFNVSYRRAGAGETSYTVELRSLVEWVDKNGNHRIDANETANATALGSAAFAGVPVTKTQFENDDGGVINILRTHSQTGDVTLNVTVAERFMRLGGRTLTPMEVKLDLSVNRLFAVMNRNLGLDVRIDTHANWEYTNRSWDDENGFASDDAGINVTGGSPNAPSSVFFSWSKFAYANGHQIPVTFSSFAGPGPSTSDIYLAYPYQMAPTETSVSLVHDPVLGVDSAAYEGIISRQPPLQGDALVYGVSLAAMAVLIGVTIVLANRRRKKREELGCNP